MQQMNTMNNKMHELNELNHDAKNAQAYAWYVDKYAIKNMSLASNDVECRLHINFFLKRCKSIANILTTTISNL